MKIIVFVKVVGGELSPFDEAALENALRLREGNADFASCEIYVITMAPDKAADRMRAITRLGVDHAILLSDPVFAGSDTAATSYILSLAAKRIIGDEREYLILCGRQSMDGDTAQVGVSVAARLGIPAITNVMNIEECSCDNISVETRLGRESAALPALLTCERICKLRFAPMRARVHDIERWNSDTLSADKRRCGLSGSPTKVVRSFESQRGRRSCVFLQPDIDILCDKINELRNAELNENIVSEISDKRLYEVYAVGDDVAEIASRIAERVVTLGRMTAEEYVCIFKDKRPSVVLFPSDVLGRRIAPEVATALDTGLCADCTLLETDGERLFMYRPAFGGSVTAKIICRTLPQMATVRTVSESSDVIVSCGLGVRGQLDTMKVFADFIGAEMGASRGLVDAGLASYEWQVGITGRTVAPKIYIAVGISGAVHHTAAIEGSRYIIGVNPDKAAPIFDYCDYGICAQVEDLLHDKFEE
ncbi:MAG: hypothetical protein HFE63_03975 [Clostridiales bacterium]|nr:hypothetical protein [Clostridiales bacterium]